MKTSNKKRTTIAILLCSLLATMVIGGSLAFLTDNASKTNEINVVTDLGVDLDEPEWDDPDEILPGDVNYKNPYILTNESVYARIKVTYVDQNTNEEIVDEDRIALIEQVIKYDPGHADIDKDNVYTSDAINTIPMINTENFEAVDGETNGVTYYYYKTDDSHVLAVESRGTQKASEELFTTIVIPSDWSNEEIETLGRFNIAIEVQAVQAENVTAEDDTLENYHAWFNTNYSD